MVVSKDAKKKRKESPMMDTSPEMPKRTKVQAQRKFAQGQGAQPASYPSVATSSVSSLAVPGTSQPGTPIRENREPPPELITHKRPRTEDFLTFLCFRGTSVLPTHLDFLNQNKNSSNKGENKVNVEASGHKDETKPKASTSKEKDTEEQHQAESSNKLDQKTEIIPFAVRKRAEHVAEGNRKQKSNERVSRLRERLIKKEETNYRRSTRTRISKNDSGNLLDETIDVSVEENEEEIESVKEVEEKVKKPPTGKNKKKIDQKKTIDVKEIHEKKEKKLTTPVKETPVMNKIADVKETTKQAAATKKLAEIKEPTKETHVTNKITGIKEPAKETLMSINTTEAKELVKEAPVANKKVELEESVTEETVQKRKKPKAKRTTTPVEPSGRMTRQRAFFEPVKVPRRESEEKEIEKESIKELEKESIIKQLDKIETKTDDIVEQKCEFSSDDEQPLAKTMKLTKNSPKKTPKGKKPAENKLKDKKKINSSVETEKILTTPSSLTQTLNKRSLPVELEKNLTSPTLVSIPSPNKRNLPVEKEKNLIGSTAVSTPPLNKRNLPSEVENIPTCQTAGSVSSRRNLPRTKFVEKETVAIPVRAESVSRKSDISSKPSVKAGKKRPAKADKDKNDLPSEDDTFGKMSPKRRGKIKETDLDPSQQSQTDFSENDTRTGRPMRKTKEAATIYMELIGQKLNLDGFDDDDSSVDSYPELPNAKKTQKLENDLKKNVEKQKYKPKVARKGAKVQKKTVPKKSLQKNKILSKKKEENKVEPDEAEEKSKKDKQTLFIEDNPKEVKKKLEKSFSDSDDEPLATKVNKPAEKEAFRTDAKNDGKKSEHSKSAPTKVDQKTQKSVPQDKPTVEAKGTAVTPEVKPILVTPSPSKLQNKTVPNRTDGISKVISPTATAFPPLVDRFPSPKVNPTFLTPKFDRNIERRVPVDSVPTSSSTSKLGFLASPSPVKNDTSVVKSTSPSSSVVNSKKQEPENFLSANLMPSKEESGKIFGIASVSLAQSSGPDNTKCTLGKCGSIHKPVLGPVVPTEAYLGEQLSSKERRKAKVNMTHEQIQKWLIECSSNPDDIQDDIDDDFESPLKPMTFAPTPPLIRDDKETASLSLSSSSKTTKDIVKSESVWSGKGPSLKATPIVVREEQKSSTPVPEPPAKQDESSDNIYDTSKKSSKVIETARKEEQVETKKKTNVLPKITRENVKSPKPSTSSTPTSSPKHQKNVQAAKEANKKEITVKQVQKRQLVYNAKISDMTKKKPITNSFAAFSPENEASVYSFDKEDDVPPPMSKPFRRQSRRESHNEDSQSEKPNKNDKEKLGKGGKSGKLGAVGKMEKISPKEGKMEKVSPKEVQQNSISVTLSPEENSKLVKVSLEGDAAFKTEKGQGNEIGGLADSDSEGHTFYIPLQGIGAAGATGGKSDVIQGVAVKLGREGPDGPNQRVIMHATLVTKAQMGSNTTPIPESMNVHEIVKSLLSSSNKDTNVSTGSKSVPVGTVQPRFKSTQDASGSGLLRVNSNSSLFSGSNKSRTAAAAPKKIKDDTPIKMCNNTAFPRRDDPAQMVEAPTFRPTEKEFQDPMEFIERITPIAARFGICKIIPPSSFKPECRISDDMRFTAYNQYVHKMLHRWGPSAKELSAIKKYLATQSIAMVHPPWIGGMEVDLPRLYHTVQELGGLKEVIEKKKWARVAEEMCIPKLAQDRVTKLDDIYCKYLLPYDTLSPAERQKLFDEVEADWAKREARARRNADRCVNLESVSNEDEGSSDEDEESEEEVDGVSMECIVKGRNMPLSQFFRIARNTMALWFKNAEPTVTDIEAEFWRHVAVRDSHVCVHSGSIDSSGWGYGFPTPGPKAKGSQCARHPWNLKILTNNTGSVLRSLGPVMGVTVPTLHVGMLFSACCWYRDPHGLSWIEYLHTGASKIWYGIPDEQSSSFRAALTALIPTHCQNKTIWLPCDTVMVPPHMLTDRNVSLCRTEQKPGEFVVIFPRAYTSSVASGYVVSESVYFATSSWLDSAKEDFKDIHDSCEPAMFSLEQLLFAVASDQRVSVDILSQILPMLTEVYEKEVAARQQLKASGVTSNEKFPQNSGKPKQKLQVVEVYECDLCRANLYISMVKTEEGNIYCLQHALKNINSGNIQAKQCTLIFKYSVDEIEDISKKLKDRLEQKKTTALSGNKKGQHPTK